MRWDLYTSAEKMQVLWVCIGLPVLLLAAWLVRDWMDAGGSKKARKAPKHSAAGPMRWSTPSAHRRRRSRTA